MKKIFILLAGFMFFSCNEKSNNVWMEVPVDIDQNISLPLSEIADEIKAIPLELTDESTINPDRIIRILLTDNNVIVAENRQILLFSMEGKFIRAIGSRGQGPGEFTMVRNITVDKKNNLLFVNSNSKMICYDLNGNFLKELTMASDQLYIKDLNYIDNYLLLIAEQLGKKDEKGLYNHSVIYKLNDNMQFVDSCTIRDTYFEKIGLYIHPYENIILNGNETIYLYYSDIYFNEQLPLETVLRDTLYSLKNNHLIPELTINFKNSGIDGDGNKFIQLFNIYRSSQYIFAFYHNDNKKNFYHFCYDIKTGKGYNMQDGYTDDINNIETPVKIRPINLDTEMFYYWHTHINSDDLEEQNPTLYIGKLKK